MGSSIPVHTSTNGNIQRYQQFSRRVHLPMQQLLDGRLFPICNFNDQFVVNLQEDTRAQPASS